MRVHVTKRMVVCLAMLVCTLGLWLPGPVLANEKVTLAHFFDKGYETIYYAIKAGKVTSDLIDIEFHPLNISALIQATGARQFDIVETSALGIIRGRQRGLDVKIIMSGVTAHAGYFLLVPKASLIKTAYELKGKTVGVFSLGATAVAYMRLLLAKRYRLDSRQGGNVTIREVPMATMGMVLLKGQVAAAYTIQSFSRRMLDSGEFRPLVDIVPEWKKLTNVKFMPSVYATYESVLAKKAKLMEEVQRMTFESSQYAAAHKEEVAQALAKKFDRPAKMFRNWMTWNTITGELRNIDRKSLQTLYQTSKEAGFLKSYPPVESLVYRGYWKGK